jgi:hypothetical protein
MNVLNNDIETVSTLMEHVFSQTPTLCLQVIAIIEDTAVQLCKILKTSADSVRYTKHNRTFEKNDNGNNTDFSSYLIQPTVFSTHSEIYGMPLITVKDLNLLIILSRTLSAGQRVEGEPQLPAMLFDCSERPPKGDLVISKAFLMVALCCSSLTVYQEMIERTQNANISDNEINSNSNSNNNSSKNSHDNSGSNNCNIRYNCNNYNNNNNDNDSIILDDIVPLSLNKGVITSIRSLLSNLDELNLNSNKNISNNLNISNSNISNFNVNESKSWLISARATELVAASLYMVIT